MIVVSTIRLAALFPRDLPKWQAATPTEHRLNRVFEKLATLGIEALLVPYADDVVDQVRTQLLRCDGVLVYEERLAAHIDAGRPLRAGPQEREIRACAVHACELLSARLGVAPRVLDNWLWNRGQSPRYKALPRHRCRCVYY